MIKKLPSSTLWLGESTGVWCWEHPVHVSVELGKTGSSSFVFLCF